MVYAVAFAPAAERAALDKCGFDDSKKLAEADRDRLFAAIRASGTIGHAVHVLCPVDISRHMLARCVSGVSE